MTGEFNLSAEPREDVGKGASRRLRRANKVPAIIYGADKAPTPIALDQNDLIHHLENEAFYSHILTVDIAGHREQVVLKDLQRHPYKALINHLDLQRVSAKDKIRMHVPLHFVNEATAPGVRQGGLVSHQLADIEIQCLPSALPEFIEVDLSGLELGATIHVADLKMPKGVEIYTLAHGSAGDEPVVSILGRGAAEDLAEGEGGEEGGLEGGV